MLLQTLLLRLYLLPYFAFLEFVMTFWNKASFRPSKLVCNNVASCSAMNTFFQLVDQLAHAFNFCIAPS